MTAVDPMSGRASDVALTIVSVFALRLLMFRIKGFKFKAVYAKHMQKMPFLPQLCRPQAIELAS